MLRSVKTGISKDDTNIAVSFEHVGSLFRIVLSNNSGVPLNGITNARLVAGAHIKANQYQGSAVYTPIDNKISTYSFTFSLPFKITETNLPSGNKLEFWGWQPPVPDYQWTGNLNWPGLSLEITTTGGTYKSINGKPRRTSPTSVGKAYHFYALFDGTDLQFTNSEGIPDTDTFIDPRDNNVYKIVTIGSQTWMAENLAYLPAVSPPEAESQIFPHYYVYGNYDPNPYSAKFSYNYQTYGALYNWPAAISGACPEGWHLPGEAEWTILVEYLANNGYNYDGSIGFSEPIMAREKMGKSIASASGWNSSTAEGAAGNSDFPSYINKSGFSAIPGGVKSGPNFVALGGTGAWWGSTDYGNLGTYMSLSSYSRGVFINRNDKIQGLSVRCIRN